MEVNLVDYIRKLLNISIVTVGYYKISIYDDVINLFFRSINRFENYQIIKLEVNLKV